MEDMNFIRMFFLSFLFISNSQSTSDYKKVCQGTSLGLTHQKWTEERYTSLYNRYANCTHVDGNLELVFITDPDPDLTFLSGIKEVTGYVLIAISYVDFIPLTSLRVIRGRTLYHDNEGGLSNFYSLYVYLNFNPEDPLNVGLKELQLNSLHEIQSGSVFVQHNNRLCHGNDILWRDIVTGESSLIKTSEQHDPSHPQVQCESCHQTCDFNGTKFCWGQGPENCQKLNRETCSKQCGGQCFGSLPNQCCDSECIGGCVGPGEDQCWACKNFDDNGVCQKFCPPEFIYDSALFKQVPNPNFKYSYGTLCVDKCPDHLNSRQGACVQECGKGMIANEDRKCVECNGTCPKECKFDFPLNSKNVHTLKDCTIVHGSIYIPDLTFQRDDYLNIPAMNVSDLSFLKDIREVSGFIKIQADVSQLKNLSFLSNLEIIHGMKVDLIASSLHIYKTNLEFLGLNSLKEIRNGAVFISSNNKLCHSQSIAWDKIVKNTKQKVVILNNNPNCEGEGKICYPECSSDGCWGPRDDQCFSCKNFKFIDENNQGVIKCVSSCSRSGMFDSAPNECRPCHEECSTNCFGPNSDQCDSCKRAKDGPYCVSKCPQAKYLDEEGICRECHPNCDEDGCTGPLSYQSAQGCRSCKLPLFNWRDAGTLPPNSTACLTPGSKCPSGHFMRMFKTACMGCNPLCRECVGPTLEECLSCKSFRQESKCTSSCPSNYYKSMQPFTSSALVSIQNTSSPDKNKVFLEATCLPCHHNCLKCIGPSNRNCSICKQYKVFLNESSVDPRDFYCAEKCPEDKPESVVINMETICQPFDYAARGRMIATISLVVSISFVTSTIVALIFCLKKQKAQNNIREAKVAMSQANTKDEVSQSNGPSKIPDMSSLIIIKSSELAIGSSIGNGAYGEVHKGMWRPKGMSPIEVAIKILKENSQEILDEARIMASVNHECCIKILCVSLSAELMLITPLMKLGCMLDYVRKNIASITHSQILLWSKQIAMGMDHLESREIVHCDLAARNVLVDSVRQVKITDFGLARLHLWKELQSMSAENEVPNKMPVKWLAPESLKEKAFTHKSDVWSYGITIWELCSFGDRPYKFITNFSEVFKYLKDGKRLEKPEICSPEFYEHLKNCWLWEPGKRPKFADLTKAMNSMLSNPLKFINIKPEHRRPTFTNHIIRSDHCRHPANHNNNIHHHHHENNCSKPIDYLEPPVLYKNLLQVKEQSPLLPPSYANISFKKDHRDSRESNEITEVTYIPSLSDLSHSYKNDFTPGFLDRPTRLESVRSPDLTKYNSYEPYVNGSPVPKKCLGPSKAGDFNPLKDKQYEHEYYNALDFST